MSKYKNVTNKNSKGGMKVKVIFKFIDGERVTVEKFDELTRSIQFEGDLFDWLVHLKQNDLSININGSNGETYNRTGKDLASFEIVLS